LGETAEPRRSCAALANLRCGYGGARRHASLVEPAFAKATARQASPGADWCALCVLFFGRGLRRGAGAGLVMDLPVATAGKRRRSNTHPGSISGQEPSASCIRSRRAAPTASWGSSQSQLGSTRGRRGKSLTCHAGLRGRLPYGRTDRPAFRERPAPPGDHHIRWVRLASRSHRA